jgi:hypothetical protein
MATSSPSVPHAAKAFACEMQRLKVEDIERLARRQAHVQKASADREKLDSKVQRQRQRVQREMQLEESQFQKRMQMDKAKREQRWTQKTEGHPFATDQWALDAKIYDANRVKDARTSDMGKSAARASMDDQTRRRHEKTAEIDVLGNLRREKKKLQEDQKELKARLDLYKVEKRCNAAQLKADMRSEAHQDMLARRGTLNKSHSDFFTEKRHSAAELDALVNSRRDVFSSSGRMLAGGQRTRSSIALSAEGASPKGDPSEKVAADDKVEDQSQDQHIEDSQQPAASAPMS